MTDDALTVRDLIERQEIQELFFVTTRDSVQQAATVMQAHGVSAIAVVESGKLTGIVSEKDISHLVARGGDPATTAVRRIMTINPVTVDEDMPLIDIARFMLERNIRHLPVLIGGEPRTTVSMRDLLSLLFDHLTGEDSRQRADMA